MGDPDAARDQCDVYLSRCDGAAQKPQHFLPTQVPEVRQSP